jgi:hypothetical protein
MNNVMAFPTIAYMTLTYFSHKKLLSKTLGVLHLRLNNFGAGSLLVSPSFADHVRI